MGRSKVSLATLEGKRLRELKIYTQRAGNISTQERTARAVIIIFNSYFYSLLNPKKGKQIRDKQKNNSIF